MVGPVASSGINPWFGSVTGERFQRIGRNWGYEYEQSQDDVDEIFLLDPPDHLTKWNVQ